MKAPEKIYLQVCGDCKDDDCKNCKFEDLEDNITWCRDEIFKNDVEYTRTDVFIEKAQDFFRQSHHLFGLDGNELYHFIEDFRKYMKGE